MTYIPRALTVNEVEAIASRQEVFDIVARHLIAQAAPSMSAPDGAQCMYRGAEGRMCAVGVLIPDAFYTKELEGNSPHFVCSIVTALKPYEEILERLQIAHDNAASEYPDVSWLDDCKRLLRDVATEYRLDPELAM